MNLLQVRILVNDFHKSAAFYRDQLELKADWYEESMEYALFNTGAARIELLSRKAMGEALGEDLVQSGSYATNFVLNIEVENIDDTYNRLSDKGIEFVKEPFNHPTWNGRLAHFRDADGTLIELYQANKKED
ncbi:lactoylglutathione lyase [Paenibacillus sp. V4I9]|uniref:VOC family protein n=1 Tax=Paenibacillus sp. V4I9 TaxID=3042308 RepID=UPI00277FF650|nr:VOC family protein [Paenibacillus sp. V4I9]MDQ0891800.1 lactoylglutathione lyase [Paenibacillus sp. V4I9]